MKRITLTLDDKSALRFIEQLLGMNVPFAVDTLVARDPLVLAAAPPDPEPVQAAVGTAIGPARPDRTPEAADADKDPAKVAGGFAAARTGAPSYTRYDRPHRTVQRLTKDGHTSMEVVESKIRQIGKRRFHIDEIKSLSAYSGFQPDTLQNQLHILAGKGKLVKVSRQYYQAAPSYAATLRPPVEEAAADPQLPFSEPASSLAPPAAEKASAPTSTAPAASTRPPPSDADIAAYEEGLRAP